MLPALPRASRRWPVEPPELAEPGVDTVEDHEAQREPLKPRTATLGADDPDRREVARIGLGRAGAWGWRW